MEREYKYDAFISYRHTELDKAVASKLQKMLENYKPPKSAVNSDFKKWKIFRDETELSSSSDLSHGIKDALENSRNLIVICSETTSDSRWCMEEIDYFKQLHNGSNANIIPLVTEGNPEVVFPPQLCTETIKVTDSQGNISYQNRTIEPMAANVSSASLKKSTKKLKSEFLRIAAPILGCDYDQLYNRAQKNKIRKIITIAAVIIMLLTMFGTYAGAMYYQLDQKNAELQKAYNDLEAQIAETEKQRHLADANAKEAEANMITAQANEKEANAQKNIAEKNEKEAKSQKNKAEQNAAEAQKQKKTAEENAAEAQRQRESAEINAAEARHQKGVAETNMLIALENESKANEANHNLTLKNNEILTSQAQMYLDDDNITAAIDTAIQAIPASSDTLIPKNGQAESIVTKASAAYETNPRFTKTTVALPGHVEYLEFSKDGKTIVACDSSGAVHLIDFASSKIKKTFMPYETFSSTYISIPNLAIDNNTLYMYQSEKLISVNLTDGTINWELSESLDIFLVDGIITNSDSDIIALSSIGNLYVISKSGTLLATVSKPPESNYTDTMFAAIDNDNNIYYTSLSTGSLYIYNPFTEFSSRVDLPVEANAKLIHMSNTEDCIYVNLAYDTLSLTQTNAAMICIDKKDYSIKWHTPYVSTAYISSWNYNTIFRLKHNVPDDEGVYSARAGIVSISGSSACIFDEKSGEMYFSAVLQNDRFLKCSPNEVNSINASSTYLLWDTLYLVRGYEGSPLSSFDAFTDFGSYLDYEKEIACVAYIDSSSFVYSMEKSSEVSIYKTLIPNNYTIIAETEYPYPTPVCATDDGNGTLAYIYSISDSNKTRYKLSIFDTKSNEERANIDLDGQIKFIRFTENGKIFASGTDGYTLILDKSGNVLNELQLKDIFVSLFDTFYDYSTLYLNSVEVVENIVLCTNGKETAAINLREDTPQVLPLLSIKSYGGDCCSIKDTAMTWISSLTSADIVYYVDFKDGIVHTVSQDGNPIKFTGNTLLGKPTWSADTTKLAFVSIEGYVGIYDITAGTYRTMDTAKDNLSAKFVSFTPDSKHIIVICTNGQIAKYNADTLEVEGVCLSSVTPQDSTTYEYADENVLLIKNSNTVYLIETESMTEITHINKFAHFMKDKKIVFCFNKDSKSYYAYYNYLTGEKLTSYAESFVKNR